MKQDKKSFRHESLQDQQSILKFLYAISEGLENGKLVLSDEEDEISLSPEGLLQLKLTATQEGNHYNLGLKLSWQSSTEKSHRPNSLQIATK